MENLSYWTQEAIVTALDSSVMKPVRLLLLAYLAVFLGEKFDRPMAWKDI